MKSNKSQSDLIISVVAPHLQQPVADLVEKLIKNGFCSTDRVSANFYENGYSISAILLLAAMMESMLQRDRYFLQKAKPGGRLSKDSAKYLKESLGYRRHSRVREFFDLRNSVAHNHMWEIEYKIPDSGGRTHQQSKLIPDSHQLKNTPDINARIPRTPIVRFNMLPARIDRTDLIKAFEVFNHTLEHLYKKEQRPVLFLANSAIFGTQRSLPFNQLVDKLRISMASA